MKTELKNSIMSKEEYQQAWKIFQAEALTFVEKMKQEYRPYPSYINTHNALLEIDISLRRSGLPFSAGAKLFLAWGKTAALDSNYYGPGISAKFERIYKQHCDGKKYDLLLMYEKSIQTEPQNTQENEKLKQLELEFKKLALELNEKDEKIRQGAEKEKMLLEQKKIAEEDKTALAERTGILKDSLELKENQLKSLREYNTQLKEEVSRSRMNSLAPSPIYSPRVSKSSLPQKNFFNQSSQIKESKEKLIFGSAMESIKNLADEYKKDGNEAEKKSRLEKLLQALEPHVSKAQDQREAITRIDAVFKDDADYFPYIPDVGVHLREKYPTLAIQKI